MTVFFRAPRANAAKKRSKRGYAPFFAGGRAGALALVRTTPLCVVCGCVFLFGGVCCVVVVVCFGCVWFGCFGFFGCGLFWGVWFLGVLVCGGVVCLCVLGLVVVGVGLFFVVVWLWLFGVVWVCEGFVFGFLGLVLWLGCLGVFGCVWVVWVVFWVGLWFWFLGLCVWVFCLGWVGLFVWGVGLLGFGLWFVGGVLG